jgi:hypothetical protein
MRHVKAVQWQDGAGIGRKPLDGIVFCGHRENTEPVALEQKIRIEHGRRTKLIVILTGAKNL